MKRNFTFLMAAFALMVSMMMPLGMKGQIYSRISSASDLADGDQIIFVNQDETHACGTTQNTNNRTPVAISVSNHTYSYNAGDNVQVFTVRVNSSGKYGFHTGSGYIYSASSSSNNLKTNTTPATTAPSGTSAWSLSASSSVFSCTNVTNTSYYLAFNGTSYFSQYKTGQSKPYIYKKQSDVSYAIIFNPGNGTCATPSVTQNSGTSFTLPTASPSAECANMGWTFAGWATSRITETTTAPTLLTGSYTITGDATLYAVYKAEAGIGPQTTIFNFEAIASANNWINGTQYTTVTLSPITLTAFGGGNCGKYYDSNHTWRIYSSQNGGVTVTTTSGSITAVSSDPSVPFTISNGSASFTATNQTEFSSISVTYESSLFTFATSPICMEQVATPTFSPAAGSYSTAQNVTISCATENATIYYSTDGTAPTTSSSVYSSAIAVTETTTIKAMAVKTDMANSEVATGTFTIESTITVTNTPTSPFPYTGGTGSFDFSITNPVTGATVTAVADSWMTATVSNGTVNFQVAQNDGVARSGNITLNYVSNGTTLTSTSVSISQEANPALPGSEGNPYTVAQAVANTPNSGSSGLVYVKGIVSRIVEIEVMQYHNARYYISNDGSTSSQELQVFRGRNINNTDFLSEDELMVGDSVVVYGQLKKYNNAAELDAGNYIVYLYRVVEPVTFSPVPCVTTSGTTISLYSTAFDNWDAEIYYTTDGNEPSRSNGTYYDVWGGDLITLTQTTTIKAVAYVPDLDKYSTVTQATYTIVDPNMPGWVGNPYTVSQAIAAIDAASNHNIKGAYVQGIISRITQIELAQYYNATYFISDNGQEQNELQVYRGKYLSQGDFSSNDDIQVGDQVIVYGDLTLFNNTTHEFKPKNYIYDLQRSSSIIINQNHLDVNCNATAGTIEVYYSSDILVNINNPTVQFCDAQGNAASYDWLTVSLNQDDEWNLEYSVNANNGASPRTAYLKVSCQNIVSNIVTITQSEYQTDFATLPFSFDGGRVAAESTTGLKPSNLGTDYSNSPKLRFHNPTVNGNIMMSSLVLKINEVPGTLVYDIKANPGSGTWSGIFKVQSSADGLTWVDQVTYNNNDSNCASLGNSKQTDTIFDLPNATRYIRWIYTTHSNGNVALGNIKLNKPTIYYDIVLNQPQMGGVIYSSLQAAAAGETVTLGAVNDEGYVLAEWNVFDEDQQPVALADPYALVTTFVMPASDVAVEASFVPTNTEFQYAYSVNGTLGTTQSAAVGTLITLPNSNNIIGLPFTFIGWSTDANNVENVMSAGTSYRLSRNVTFYAVYAETVAGSVAVKQYARVTADLETNWAGDYLIAYSSSIFADGRIGGTSNNGIGYANVSVNPGNNLQDNMVEALWGDVYRVTLEEVSPGSNTYLLKTQDGKYNYYTSNTNNGLAATTNRDVAMNYPITVNFESADDIRLSLGGNAEGSVFRYNPDGYFRFYKNCGQDPVYLYKKTVNIANRYTRVFVDNPSGSLTIAGPSIVPNGSVLNVASITNTLGADRLVVEEGAQLVTSSDVNASIKRFINPYQGSADNYYLISSPVDGQNPVGANMTNNNYDLYYFDQSAQGEEWQNYEANTFVLESGKGYLYANSFGDYITMSGLMEATAYDVTIEHVAGKNLAGWNLIGNPYPCNVTINKPFYRLEGGTALATLATDNSVAIAPMEGVFVYADSEEDVSFTKAPTTSTTGRGGNTLSLRVRRNQNTKDGRVEGDNAIIRFGEGSLLRKLVLNPDLPQIYVAQDGTDYAIVNAEAEGELPISFRAAENGSYTISVDAEEVSFGYLHLIDNMTGVDVDLLALQQAQEPASYTFDANTADYACRFKLVFATHSIFEDADGGNETFAYFNGSAWVVNAVEGDAILQVVDMTGRVILSNSAKAGVSVNAMPQGIYVLRLIDGDNVKTQKIINK